MRQSHYEVVMSRLTFLGTGASMGVPVIGCKCPVCTSDNPKNNRMRCSALLEVDGKRLLIDAGPDIRTQALRGDIDHVDGVLITHAHYDHIGGLDELRTFFIRSRHPVPLLLSEECLTDVKRRFFYFFETPQGDGPKNLVAQLDITVLPGYSGAMTFCDIPLQWMTYSQGSMGVTGYRFGDLAYLSDVGHYGDDIFGKLGGIKTLIVSALRDEESHLHFTVDEAVEFANRVGADKTYFIHMAHTLDHDKTNSRLPEGIELAYDGLEVEFSL